MLLWAYRPLQQSRDLADLLLHRDLRLALRQLANKIRDVYDRTASG